MGSFLEAGQLGFPFKFKFDWKAFGKKEVQNIKIT